jgi:hypothetical protein
MAVAVRSKLASQPTGIAQLNLSNIDRISSARGAKDRSIAARSSTTCGGISRLTNVATSGLRSRDQPDRVFAADGPEIGGLESELFKVVELVETEIRIVRTISDFRDRHELQQCGHRGSAGGIRRSARAPVRGHLSQARPPPHRRQDYRRRIVDANTSLHAQRPLACIAEADCFNMLSIPCCSKIPTIVMIRTRESRSPSAPQILPASAGAAVADRLF